MKREQWKGMGTFTAIWAGQLVSLLGTGMTQFAMTIWAWQKTGQATALALAGVCAFAPVVLVSPLAGAIVDRTSRKLLMILSDLAAGLGTLTILLLYLAGTLEIWHLYAVLVFIGTFGAFQFPAYSATISVLVDKRQYARASGMMSLAGSISGVFAPVAAGILLAPIGIAGILCVDLVTMSTAIVILLLSKIPQPARSAEGAKARGSLFREAGFGFRYIAERPGLLGLLCMFFLFNVTSGFGFTVLAPMILARTGDNAMLLGSVQSAAGIGGVVGGVLLSLWGGPKRRVRGLLVGSAIGGLVGLVGVGVGRSLPMWAGAMFTMSMIFPTVNASSQTIWQSKVPPDLQGRVFSVRLMMAQFGTPLAMLLAGPLADRVFEPGMRAGGALAGTFGPLVGTGPGAGMALMLVFGGLLAAIAATVGYIYRPLRVVETALPDHDAAEPAAVASAS
ncbi:MAG: MFS transporter [Candidatus Bipolaricaulis sp.]|nr:MFS transporter [Candidatus Bipolaricaulis sp.]